MTIESKLNSHYVQWMNLSLEQFYFYLVIVLSSLTLFCILLVMGICIFPPKHTTCQCRRKISDGKSNKSSKRVSRAESWRFESSHYINPGTVMLSVKTENTNFGFRFSGKFQHRRGIIGWPWAKIEKDCP